MKQLYGQRYDEKAPRLAQHCYRGTGQHTVGGVIADTNATRRILPLQCEPAFVGEANAYSIVPALVG